MCTQWTLARNSVVTTRQSNSPISKFSRMCHAFTSVWSVFMQYLVYSYQTYVTPISSTWIVSVIEFLNHTTSIALLPNV